MKTLCHYLLAGILAFFLTNAYANTISEQQIQFKGKAFPVSALKQRIAKQKGLPLKPVSADTLSAYLFKPEDEESGAVNSDNKADKKFPAIIMVHDCRGVQNYQKDWAKQVASWGFVVLLMDSFTTRNINSTCEGLGEQENFLIHGGRVQDVFAAHDYLSEQDYVENFRIGLLGWDYHSVLGAVAKHGMQQKFDAKFMGVVAIYPSCNATSGTDFVAPILVLIGEQDDWTPARECRIMERYARAGQESVQLRYFKNAKHGFDDPSIKQEEYYPDFRNYFKNPARGVTMQYNQQAHLESIKVIRQFLDFNIKHRPIQITLDDLPSQFTDEQINKASWINPPDEHGPRIPASGVSLFDKAFSVRKNNQWHHQIPFPFDKLLAKLATFVDLPQASTSNLKSVLIPSGRSLVRNAAAPDFFEFPRIVVGVDTQPPLYGNKYPLLLKDRLYIGYQEKANALEVISYNETAQRFEFQIVKDYLAGKQPKVEYANRSLCLGCHQNHAPIFANAPWDETNFNEQVFSRIKAKRKNFYGFIPAVPVASSANSLDRSSNRATYLPIYNALWTKGCIADNKQASVNCRSEVFKAILQYRLSNKAGFEKNTLDYQDNFLSVAAKAWQKFWPNGLAIPAANITDRNPFSEKMEVSARFDPLTLRSAQTIWFGSNAGNVEQVIIGLADQIYKSDIKLLDSLLHSKQEQKFNISKYTNDCSIKTSGVRLDILTASIDCTNRKRTEENNFDLHGKLKFNLTKNTVSGTFNSLKRQDEFILHDIRFNSVALEPNSTTLNTRFSVHNKKSTLTVRLPSGNAIEHFNLELKTNAIKRDTKTIRADLTFYTKNDFSIINNAITQLTSNNLNDSAALFSEQPFSAGLYMSQLLSTLNSKTIPEYCCQDEPTEITSQTSNKNTELDELSIDIDTATTDELFLAICGSCHRSDEPFPPNFLSGDPEQIQRNLKQCAPRIAYRLHMWKLTKNSRKKTPMPPTAPDIKSVHSVDSSWQNSPVYSRIKNYILALIESPQKNDKLLSELLKTPYEKLDNCNIALSTLDTASQ